MGTRRGTRRTHPRRRPPPCRHCRSAPAWCARGLCYACYHRHAVRDLYPSRAMEAVGRRWKPRGHGTREPLRPALVPCPHPPGSPERVETYRHRCRTRQQLYHPLDARRDAR